MKISCSKATRTSTMQKFTILLLCFTLTLCATAKEWQRNDTPKANSRREKREEPSSETESSENDDVKNEESKNAEGDEDKDEKEDAEEGEEKKEEKPCEESIYVYQVPLAIEYMEPEVYLEEF
ncbi:uncharacterized protein LOC126971869 isoform X2 [Leptidea sinapis]|uniref:uncharacterized protein LOC126971869 isoform X2 n=1 Tax=Leptidea sinapis TaxID=189913 RepID=UPI0021C2BBDC|nr:uncharacterized protein LOC126971869 isoform X2 [Leptidea sinapis]